MLEGNVGGLQHIGLPVTDIARSVDFYTRLGFHIAMEKEFQDTNGIVQVKMLELNGLVLEMYQLPAADLEGIRSRRDGHIDHIALDVLSVDRAFEELSAAGITPLEGAPVFLPFWEKGVRYFNIHGPDGERVEFNERIR